jgi:opacity protein-like surface antigen
MVAARPAARFGRASVYLLLGAGLNLLVDANKENVSGAKQDITGELHRVDVALLAGAGFALHLPRQVLGPLRLDGVLLEARHDHGLLDTDAVNGGFKNRTSSVMLGLSFALTSRASATAPASSPSRGSSPPVTAAAPPSR